MPADDPMPALAPDETAEERPRRADHPNACPECGQVSAVPEHARTGFCPYCMTHTNPDAPEAPTEPSGAEIMEQITEPKGTRGKQRRRKTDGES